MHSSYRVIIAGFVGVIGVGWWFLAHHDPTSKAHAPKSVSVDSAENHVLNQKTDSINQALPDSASAAARISSPSQSLSKVEIMQSIWAAANASSQDFYGKIIDQNDQPVVGATAVGTLMKIQGMDVGEKREIQTTQSDALGNFAFTGLHGWQLGVVVKKEGYQMRSGAYQTPNAEDKTSSEHRGVFRMWKLKGAEPLIHRRIHAYIACDGTINSYDLLTGHKASQGGDLSVKLTRNPVDITRGKPFDWSISMTIPDGGFVESKDLYTNEAPAEGYQQTVTIDAPASDSQWSPSLTRTYYFKTKNGQDYGRMTIGVQADFQPPPTLFDAEIYLNPAGSRNLEFDSSKEINPQ